MSTILTLPSSPHSAPRTMMVFKGAPLSSQPQVFCGGDVRELAELREDLFGDRVVDVDERHGRPAHLAAPELQPRDVDPLLAEECPEAPHDARHVLVLEH